MEIIVTYERDGVVYTAHVTNAGEGGRMAAKMVEQCVPGPIKIISVTEAFITVPRVRVEF